MVYNHCILVSESVENKSLNQKHRLHDYYTDIIVPFKLKYIAKWAPG